MSKLKFETLLEAGVHFGHLKRKWNPAMAPYIFEEKKGIHIIDLNKTMVHLDQACAAMKQIAKSGKKNIVCSYKKTSERNRFGACSKNQYAICYRTVDRWYVNKLPNNT